MPSSPFPQGMPLPDGDALGRAIRSSDAGFWIHATQRGRRALLMTPSFANAATDALGTAKLEILSFAEADYRSLVAGGTLDVVDQLSKPRTADEATTFALALASAPDPVRGAIYDEARATLIPFATAATTPLTKAEVLGRYLTGGVEVSGDDVLALARILPKFDVNDLGGIAASAGLTARETLGKKAVPRRGAVPGQLPVPTSKVGRFDLPGRRSLSDFFNEHVIDIVGDEARYAALGIGFPGGIILEGPTGCGKTFAVERLVEHLGWSSFAVEASSVASPYIHETSRKVAQVFADAVKAAPSVIVIDEMDAFLSTREAGSHQHHVEEIAEFLRRIPEASKNRVLVVGMTNQIDAIDPAILRRGRFDHVIHVDHAGRDEVEGLLQSLLSDIPNDVTDVKGLAGQLAGRPLSDVAFVVREAGRLAARARKERIGPDEITAALAKSPSRNADDQRKIGF